MSDKKNAIIALLSVNFALNSDQTKELQSHLHAEGFTKNSDRFAEPDGIMGNLTSTDIIAFIAENPEALLTISPTMMQKLTDGGFADDLKSIAEQNPNIEQALAAQAKEILNGQNIDALHQTPELKELQTKLKLLGEYNGKIDGLTGQKSRGAATSLKNEFAQAAAPAPAEPIIKPQELENNAAAQPDEPAVSSADTSLTAYMQALEFKERGLMQGDGGERDWNNKRDPEVWNLQVLLNRAGADIAIDGDYGGGTNSAVRAFQEEHNLPVTGQADFETLKTLSALPETQFSVSGQNDAKMYTIAEHDKIIADISPHVEQELGVSGGYLIAVRGMETHFGTDMKSGTGSQGPFQFTGRTFNAVINRYGDQIAENLKDIGQEELAKAVLESQAGTVDRTLRFDPYVATYAVAYFTKENRVDTMDPDNWGQAYAAHNIGRGGLNTVQANLNTANVGAVLDRKYDPDPAKNNPHFFRGGASGSTVLNRYQHEMETWHNEYNDRVAPKLEAIETMQAAGLNADAAMSHTIQAPIMTAGNAV